MMCSSARLHSEAATGEIKEEIIELGRKSFILRLHFVLVIYSVRVLNKVRQNGLCQKLQRSWKGLFIVFNKLGDLIYKIQETAKSKPVVIHHNRLKPYVEENACTHLV